MPARRNVILISVHSGIGVKRSFPALWRMGLNQAGFDPADRSNLARLERRASAHPAGRA
jgi:hypothetical protein